MSFSKKLSIGILISFMFFSNGFAEKNPFNLEKEEYQSLLNETIVTQGNNFRLKKVIEKIRLGEKVTVAIIGGSVTEGAGPQKFNDGYAYQFFRALKSKYAPGEGLNLFLDNAGLSGTSSLIGIVRYKQDVIDVLNQTPDLLIIEFGVNDGGEQVFQRSFEALVREALVANSETAVIALYCAASYGNTGAAKKKVADYYNIPQLDMLSIVNKCLKKGTFKKENYYADYVHPTYEGHQFMCDCLMNLVEIADKSKIDESFEVPEKVYIEPSFCGMIQISEQNEDVKLSVGGFDQYDKATQTLKKTNSVEFKSNWHHKMHTQPNNEPFKMEIFCKNLIFVWKNQSSGTAELFGNVEVFVDGKRVAIYNGGKQGGWNNCEVNVIIDEPIVKNHTVEIKMSDNSQKLGFTILAMGYTK